MNTVKKQNAFVDFDLLMAAVWIFIGAMVTGGAAAIWFAPDLYVGSIVCAARMTGACMLVGGVLLARAVWRQR